MVQILYNNNQRVFRPQELINYGLLSFTQCNFDEPYLNLSMDLLGTAIVFLVLAWI